MAQVERQAVRHHRDQPRPCESSSRSPRTLATATCCEAYDRHRNLEHAGRFEEIFAPEMTVEHPVYRFAMAGQPPMHARRPRAGRAALPPLGGDQPVDLLQRERDRSRSATGWSSARWSATSRRWARRWSRAGSRPTRTRCTCCEGRVAMVWPYDERGRLVGENVWEYDDVRARADQARSRRRPDHRAGRRAARAADQAAAAVRRQPAAGWPPA